MKRSELQHYIKKGFSQREIATAYKCGQTNVRYWLEKYGLKTNKANKPRKTKPCAYCGKAMEVRVKNQNKYCSSECLQNAHLASLVPKMITGEISAFSAKHYLIKTRGIQCEICGITKWRGKPVSLILDHINGNSNDNRINNLRLICGNCDMQLATYKGRNHGNGRFYRRERYKLGKSY